MKWYVVVSANMLTGFHSMNTPVALTMVAVMSAVCDELLLLLVSKLAYYNIAGERIKHTAK